jgi:DNA-binding IscR family transcriptional regulator
MINAIRCLSLMPKASGFGITDNTKAIELDPSQYFTTTLMDALRGAGLVESVRPVQS